MTFDAIFKEMLQEFPVSLDLQSNVSVGKLPLQIDLVGKRDLRYSSQYLPWFQARIADLNLIEYKSARDIWHPYDICKQLGYLGLYSYHHKTHPRELSTQFTLWIICVKIPSFLSECLKLEIIKPESSNIPGLYQIFLNLPCKFYLVIIDELSISNENIPLIFTASGQRYEEVAKWAKTKDFFRDPIFQRYITLNFFTNYSGEKSMTELLATAPEDIKQNVRMAVEKLGIEYVTEAVGIKKVVDAIGVKKVVDALGVKKVVDALGVKKVVDALGIKTILRQYSKAELQKMIEDLD
jgi:hypothetical protein